MRWRTGLCAALAAGAVAALVACATEPTVVAYVSEGDHITTPDGLHRVKRWGFDGAYLKPSAELARYRKVIIDPVTVAYKQPRDPSRVSKDGVVRGTYALSQRTMDTVKRDFGKIFAHELGESEAFVVTQQPAPDAIRVTGYLIKLVVYTPPYSGRQNAAVSFLALRGEFTLILDVRDSKTGEPLLRVGDRSAIAYHGAQAFYPSNSVTSAAAMRRVFHRMAARLRKCLDAVQAIAEIPPAPKPAPTNG